MTDTTTNTDAKTSPPPDKTGEDHPGPEDTAAFLGAFKVSLSSDSVEKLKSASSAAPAKPKAPHVPKLTLKAADDAYKKEDWDALKKVFQDAGTKASEKEEILNRMLVGKRGRKEMLRDPKLASYFIGQADPDYLQRTDLFDALGSKKTEILSQTLFDLTEKAPAKSSDAPDRDAERDPKLFKLLAEQLDKDTWNDAKLGLGAQKKGLAPRMCAALLKNKAYDEICMLIDHGVDTSLSTRIDTSDKDEVNRTSGSNYSGFVMPLQHTLQGSLHDVDLLNAGKTSGWDSERKDKAEGARKVFQALDRNDSAVTLTKWSDVVGSEMMQAFKDDPGTVWGFEKIRGPYVEAARETKHGNQPLRMMDVWDAVQIFLNSIDYEKLLDDPETRITKMVKWAADTQVGPDIDQTIKDATYKNGKYAAVCGHKDAYLKGFVEMSTEVLQEMARQMPKGTLSRPSKDDPTRAVSDIAGTHFNKFMTSFACQAGLWMAKSEGKPVYYCLDGIEMEDVVNYKKAKYEAIDEYLDTVGKGGEAEPFGEVVTMKEMREILKNWDQFKDTIKFFRKGKMLTGKELETFISKHQQMMEDSRRQDDKKGERLRKQAPPRAKFQKELEAIDPDLPTRLDWVAKTASDPKKADQDARDIVRKGGYLLKVTNTNPTYLVNYLVKKCQVMFDYKLVPVDLAMHGSRFDNLMRTAAAKDNAGLLDDKSFAKLVTSAMSDVIAQIKKSNPQFQKPLAASLGSYPAVQDNAKWKKLFDAI